MTRIIAWTLAALLPSACLLGCGDDCGGLCGSQCDLLDCSHDTIYCEKRTGVEEGIKIDYLRNPDTNREWAAQIFIQTDGIDKVEGMRIEGEEFLNRVLLDRPGGGQQFDDLIGKYCEITSGGDTVGKTMKGKCGFIFENGYSLTAKFSCYLEAPDI